MNSVISYLRKWSAPSHVVFLAVVGLILILKGKDLLGADYFPALPYFAFLIAVIEVVILATRPPSGAHNSQSHEPYEVLTITWMFGDDHVSEQDEELVHELVEKLEAVLESSGKGTYDTTDSIVDIEFVMFGDDARAMLEVIMPTLLASKLKPLEASAIRHIDPEHPESIEELFTKDVQ